MTSIDDVMIEITPQVLLKAYACGIFPMAESADDNALYWIEPERRGILPLDHVHVPRRLARTIRAGGFKVKIDNDFESVIEGCAAPRSGRRSTWINGRIRALYRDLFALGHCHTVEVWAERCARPAGSTASISAARSSARACSRGRATLARSRWFIWWRGSNMAALPCSTRSSSPDISRSSARSR